MKYKSSIYNNFYRFDGKDFLYNSRSGFFCGIDKRTMDYISNIEDNSEAEKDDSFSILLRKGVLTSNCIEEFNQYKIKTYSEQFSREPSTMEFVIATTRNCNLHCRYCFEGQTHEIMSMNTATQKSVISFIIDSIKKNAKCKSLHITWFGGEPLLNFDCIVYLSNELISFCEQSNINYSASIITNGLLLVPDIVERLVQLKVNFVQITIDGDENEYCAYKGATKTQFRTVISNICRFPDNVSLSIRCNTDLKNYDSIKAVTAKIINKLTDAKKKNISFYLAPIDLPEKMSIDDNDLNSILQDYFQMLFSHKMLKSISSCLPQPRYVSCGAIKRGNYCIDYDGSLLKCEHYIGDTSKICGNVFSGPNYNSAEIDLCCLQISDECRDCSLYPICRGGCAQRRLDKKYKINCDRFRERIEMILYYLSKQQQN